MATCVICGDALSPDSDFCGGCGSPRALALAPAPEHPRESPAGGAHRTRGPSAEEPHWTHGIETSPTPPSRRSNPGRGLIAGLAALVLGGMGAGGYLLLRGSADPFSATNSNAPASSATAVQPTSASSAGAVESTSAASTHSNSGATAERRVITMLESATACRAFDDSRLSTAYRGNDVTSCPFAEAVRTAYVRALGSKRYSDDVVGTLKIRAHSPITKKDYVMTCTDTNPVMCRGGNNAVVYIASYQDAG